MGEDSDRVILADAIVQAWEASASPFDRSHQIQLAMIAAGFLVEIANGDSALTKAEVE